ncbi:MAG: hypothetical protein ABI251_11890 [Mycobacteriaceae bacterium]
MDRSDVRWEIGRDVVVLAAGLALVLCTPWLNTKGDQEVTGALLVYGLVLAGTALWAMNGASRPSHWVHLVVGILVLVSPWMLQFPAGYDTANFIAVVAGLAATVAGVLGILASRRQPQPAPTEKRGSYLAW